MSVWYCMMHTHACTQSNKCNTKIKFNLCISQALRYHTRAHTHTHTSTTQVTEKWLSLWLVPVAEGKPTMANYLSLYTTAALAVWMDVSCVCVCVCTHMSLWRQARDWQIAGCRFQHTERREEKCRGGVEVGSERGEFERAGHKHKERI